MSEITNEMVYEKLTENLRAAENIVSECKGRYDEAQKNYSKAWRERENYRLYYAMKEHEYY